MILEIEVNVNEDQSEIKVLNHIKNLLQNLKEKSKIEGYNVEIIEFEYTDDFCKEYCVGKKDDSECCALGYRLTVGDCRRENVEE